MAEGRRRPRQYVPLPCVPVFGYSAHVLATVLRKHLPAEIHQYSVERREEALQTLEALELAAQDWREAQLAAVTAERGNAAQVQAAAPAPSDQITTRELAQMLGVQERQARNVGRASELGVQVGSTWVWSRAATLAHLEQQRRSA